MTLLIVSMVGAFLLALLMVGWMHHQDMVEELEERLRRVEWSVSRWPRSLAPPSIPTTSPSGTTSGGSPKTRSSDPYNPSGLVEPPEGQ